MGFWSAVNKVKSVASSVASTVSSYSSTIKSACSGALSGFAVGGVVGAVVGAGVGAVSGYYKDKEANEKNSSGSDSVVSVTDSSDSLSVFDILTNRLRGSGFGLAK